MNSNGTVFLIDDDDGLRRSTARLLTANGFEVRPFASADEYLERFDPAESGCLLLDLRMPGKSGLELQQALAQRGVPPPIIFLTGHADVPASVLAMKRGALDFLEKPVSETALLAALERAIELDEEQRILRGEIAVIRARYQALTPREREVLGEMIAGQLNKQAAFALGIAERTVKLHRSRGWEYGVRRLFPRFGSIDFQQGNTVSGDFFPDSARSTSSSGTCDETNRGKSHLTPYYSRLNSIIDSPRV